MKAGKRCDLHRKRRSPASRALRDTLTFPRPYVARQPGRHSPKTQVGICCSYFCFTDTAIAQISSRCMHVVHFPGCIIDLSKATLSNPPTKTPALPSRPTPSLQDTSPPLPSLSLPASHHASAGKIGYKPFSKRLRRSSAGTSRGSRPWKSSLPGGYQDL